MYTTTTPVFLKSLHMSPHSNMTYYDNFIFTQSSQHVLRNEPSYESTLNPKPSHSLHIWIANGGAFPSSIAWRKHAISTFRQDRVNTPIIEHYPITKHSLIIVKHFGGSFSILLHFEWFKMLYRSTFSSSTNQFDFHMQMPNE
jgi:hypothetical protein